MAEKDFYTLLDYSENPLKRTPLGPGFLSVIARCPLAQGFRYSRARMRAHVASVRLYAYNAYSRLYTLISWGQDGKSGCS